MSILTLERGDIVQLNDTTCKKSKYKSYEGLHFMVASEIETKDNKMYVKLNCIENNKIKIKSNINCLTILSRIST